MKTLSIPFILFFLLFIVACASQAELQTQQNVQRLDGTEISGAKLTREVQALITRAQVHGLALAIFNKNELVYQNSFGYSRQDTGTLLTDSTNLYGASLSKAVFAVLVMKLVEEGVIDLDTPLQNYLPKKMWEYEPKARWHDDYRSLKDDSLYHKITARMCLSHTAGFPNWRMSPDLKVLVEPGTRYMYSGEGMVYLQVVLEHLLGKNLEELAQEKIFKPLGMHNSSYEWKPRWENNYAWGHAVTGAIFPKDKDNEPRGASTLETTLEDYSKFLEAVLQQSLLSAKSTRELFKTQVRIRSVKQFGPLSLKDSTLNDNIALGYGLGWGVFQTPHGVGAFKEGHGEGFQHYSILYPEAGIGVLIMTNTDNGEGIYKELLALTIADGYGPMEWNNYVPYQQREPVADSLRGYGCPSGQEACKGRTFAESGVCPHCGWVVVPKVSMEWRD